MDRYLEHDGVFTIRLMSKKATSLVISEMIAVLYDNCIENGGESPAEEPLFRKYGFTIISVMFCDLTFIYLTLIKQIAINDHRLFSTGVFSKNQHIT